MFALYIICAINGLVVEGCHFQLDGFQSIQKQHFFIFLEPRKKSEISGKIGFFQ